MPRRSTAAHRQQKYLLGKAKEELALRRQLTDGCYPSMAAVTILTLSGLFSAAEAKDKHANALKLRGDFDPFADEPEYIEKRTTPKRTLPKKQKTKRRRATSTQDISKTRLFPPHEGSNVALTVYLKPNGTSDNPVGQLCARLYDVKKGAYIGSETCFDEKGQLIGNLRGGTLEQKDLFVVTYSRVATPTTSEIFSKRISVNLESLTINAEEPRTLLYSGNLSGLSYRDKVRLNQLVLAIPKGIASPVEIQVRNCRYVGCPAAIPAIQTQENTSSQPSIDLDPNGKLLLQTEVGLTCYNFDGEAHRADSLNPPPHPLAQTPPQTDITNHGFYVAYETKEKKGDDVDFVAAHLRGSSCAQIGSAKKELVNIPIVSVDGTPWLYFDTVHADGGSICFLNYNGPEGPELYMPYKADRDSRQLSYYKYVLNDGANFSARTAKAHQDGNKNLFVSWRNADGSLSSQRIAPILITRANLDVSSNGRQVDPEDIIVIDAMSGEAADPSTLIRVEGTCNALLEGQRADSFSLSDLGKVKFQANEACQARLAATRDGALGPSTAADIRFFPNPPTSQPQSINWTLITSLGIGGFIVLAIAACVLIARLKPRMSRDDYLSIIASRDQELDAVAEGNEEKRPLRNASP